MQLVHRWVEETLESLATFVKCNNGMGRSILSERDWSRILGFGYDCVVYTRQRRMSLLVSLVHEAERSKQCSGDHSLLIGGSERAHHLTVSLQ